VSTAVLSAAGGLIRLPRRPPGWRAPGPPAGEHPALVPGPGEDLCWLAGNWRILQRQGGHRFSLDDLVTAHFAARVAPRTPARILDLGCGIGSVLLFCAWRFPEARCEGLEAQPASAALARRSIAGNGVADRCSVALGDFRALQSAPVADLVTGTPPYFPCGTGVESDHPQRAACRFEHRGGIEAYCAAAAAALAPGGVFAVCAPTVQLDRVAPAAAAAGLTIIVRQAVVPRAGKPPLFSLFAMQREAGDSRWDPPLVVRDARGRRTEEFVRLRAEMGMPP
jgi:tRNA1Val (adenine37-N6)-methyltransferase